jgi:PAS domain S-box-containing protein
VKICRTVALMLGDTMIARDLAHRYGGAFVAVALAVVFRFIFADHLGESGFAVLLLGVLCGAWIGGVGPALLFQTVLLFVSVFWFSDPTPQPPKPRSQAIAGILAYYGVGIIVGALSESAHLFRRRAAAQTAEAAAQRKWLQTTLACMGDGVIATDSHGRITLLNPAAERMTACQASQALGQSLDHLFRVSCTDGEKLAEPVRRVLEELQPHTACGYIAGQRSSDRIPIAYHASPIVDQGQVLGAVIVFRDETERRRTEEALREADRRKDEFLATLAHELRNPLAPIRAGIEVLMLVSDDPECRAEVCSMMQRQTTHMVRLIDDLLDVSRITRGKLQLRKNSTTLAQVVQNAVEESRPHIESFEHHLTVVLPETQVPLFVDGSRLTQLISNLLHNAAKFTPQGGRISLAASATSNELHLEVRDSGQGIPREMIPKIFEKFTQISPERASQSGLGIGLNLVKSIVELHDGTIEVHSDGPDRGSCFCVRLPLGHAEFARLEPTQQILAANHSTNHSLTSPSRRRVLVVDDGPDACEMLSAMVRRLGHEVRQASDGIEAVNVARFWKPQVVLMDIGMPLLDGCDAARQIRQLPGGASVLLVAITGWGQEETRQKTKEAGFDEHLVKPVDLAHVQALLVMDISTRLPAPTGQSTSNTAQEPASPAEQSSAA